MIDRSSMPVLLLLGPPGAGKATQARLLEDRFGLVHLSIPDLLRHEIASGTVDPAMGTDTPDDVLFAVLKDRMLGPDCGAGIVLDGFPRTVAQAQTLEDQLAADGAVVNAAIRFELDDDDAMTRLTGRQRCDTCGEIYHISFRPPDQPGKCNRCGGGQFRHSAQDTPDKIRDRQVAYHHDAMDLSDFYNSRNVLRSMNAAVEIDSVTLDLRHVVRPIVTKIWGYATDRKVKPKPVEETQ